MTILITNDDGIQSKGIATLIEIARPFGDIVVVAPDTVRSGQSSAITFNLPIFLDKVKEESHLTIYGCTGTPCDCLKIGLNNILPQPPDLILSGINHGTNSSLNVVYSGTMGATISGCEQGIPSIGLSICDYSPDPDFSYIIAPFQQIIEKVVQHSLPQGVCLNVNAPQGQIKGTKICRQAKGLWHEQFVEQSTPHGRSCYWLTGSFENLEPQAEDTDEWVLANGYISIVPTTYDYTHQESITFLKTQGYEQIK